MADHPILFKPEMVNAILDGRKTQTRRLATNTSVQKYKIGDRLWVRETFANTHRGPPLYRADTVEGSGRRRICIQGVDPRRGGKWTPSIFMPRIVNRITLIVTELRRGPLLEISSDDARAEGLFKIDETPFWTMAYPYAYDEHHLREYASPPTAFFSYWDHINGRDSHRENPEVIAVTFTAHKCNIDERSASNDRPRRPDRRAAWQTMGHISLNDLPDDKARRTCPDSRHSKYPRINDGN